MRTSLLPISGVTQSGQIRLRTPNLWRDIDEIDFVFSVLNFDLADIKPGHISYRIFYTFLNLRTGDDIS